MPSLLLAFPVFHSKGPQNIDLFNLTTPSVSLTGAEVVPKVKEEPVAGWNGTVDSRQPILALSHPSYCRHPAGKEPGAVDMLGNAGCGGFPRLWPGR